jgi:hypothetical protein
MLENFYVPMGVKAQELSLYAIKIINELQIVGKLGVMNESSINGRTRNLCPTYISFYICANTYTTSHGSLNPVL